MRDITRRGRHGRNGNGGIELIVIINMWSSFFEHSFLKKRDFLRLDCVRPFALSVRNVLPVAAYNILLISQNRLSIVFGQSQTFKT
jgi:hypothetical protein